MKAAIRTIYGPPEVLQIAEIAKPVPQADEVLIKVHATTVNRTDCGVLWGNPWVFRLFIGLFKPKSPITGTDFAGVVEAVGKDVMSFKAGDKVWGFHDEGLSSHAEYLCLPASAAIMAMPAGLTFQQAAACAEGAHYAYNFLNKVKLQPGQKVLVNGATGAIGSAAVQFLKHAGLYVTATSNTPNIELVKSLGADRVIDYQREDFTKDQEVYDFVFDAVGKSTFAKCRPLLKSGGVYISSELGPGGQNPFLALLTPLLGGKKVIFPLPSNIKRSMAFTQSLAEQGLFRPVIDREYPLEEIAAAFRYVHSGQKTGNVVIAIA